MWPRRSPLSAYAPGMRGEVSPERFPTLVRLEGTTMDVVLRDIATIRPYPHNPRHNDQAVAAVAASIREFGFRQPIVVDEEGIIIVGHTRYKAALQLGLSQVPVHVMRGLTPGQIKAYR